MRNLGLAISLLLAFVAQAAARPATWCRDVAPIVQRSCQGCHRPGQIGPFYLLTYRDASAWSAMIAETVERRRMPPWQADRRHGRFANDLGLTDAERATILAWVRDGCPEGDPSDLPPPRTFTDGWQIPSPDLVLSIPEPFTVPADGIVPYQYFEVDPGFREDRWVRACEIRPTNRKVVHHCNAILKPPGWRPGMAPAELKGLFLAVAAPGTAPAVLPEGAARRWPAGWTLVFQVHYTPVGTVQEDRIGIGLVFADAKAVRKEVVALVLTDPNLCIPPHAANHRVEQRYRCPDDLLLFGLFPHTHLRGKSFRYEADYPDGTTEVLLDVPRYDFNWQHRYELAEPKRLPSGTVLRCVAHYDNSRGNPANPDPDATVREGEQTTDEMFRAHFEVALADEHSPRRTLRHAIPIAGLIVLTLTAFVVFGRCLRRAGSGRP
jgi:hypothetical protein